MLATREAVFVLAPSDEVMVSHPSERGGAPLVVDRAAGRAGAGAFVDGLSVGGVALRHVLYEEPQRVSLDELPFDASLLARCDLRRHENGLWYAWCPDEGAPWVVRER